MSPVLRPQFSEGQVLAASDLNAQVDYTRQSLILHERTEHLWGVASGLTLTTTALKKGTLDYVQVSLSPGRAVDRLGRAIVVTQPRTLDLKDFKDQVGSRTNGALYPVFVQAISVERRGQTQPGKCAVAQTTRIEESFQIVFGAPGSELPVLDAPAATVEADADQPGLFDMVLVGWVEWGGQVEDFVGVATTANNRGIRYVGVVASEVVSPSGTLGLRTRPDGSRFAVTISETATGCELRFGRQDGNGPVSPMFTVDQDGNVEYKGKLTPLPPAETKAESGVIFDGMCLPLPRDISEQQVKDGRLHVQLTPLAHAPRMLTFDFFGFQLTRLAMPTPIACTFDRDTRRVTCIVRWWSMANPRLFRDLPAACSYLVIASVK